MKKFIQTSHVIVSQLSDARSSCNSVKDEEWVNDGCSLILAKMQLRFYLNSAFGVQGKTLTCGKSSSLCLIGMLALRQQPSRKLSCETGEIFESAPDSVSDTWSGCRELSFLTIHFSFQRLCCFCGFLIIFQQDYDLSLHSTGKISPSWKWHDVNWQVSMKSAFLYGSWLFGTNAADISFRLIISVGG